MATMYVPGSRRSSAPVVSPRAALTTGAIYDDQVTQDLLDAMLSATLPAGVGQSQAGVNIGEALGSGTYIDNMFAGGGGGESVGDSGAASGGTGSVSDGLSTLGGLASGLSAIGVIGQNADIAQAAQALGQVATIGSAVNSAAQGNIGQAAMTVAPAALSAMGLPAGMIGLGMTAANPALGQTDMNAALGKAALGMVSPAALATISIAEMLGLVNVKGLMTPVENLDVTDATIADTALAQALAEEGAAIALGFGDSGIATGETGVSAVGEANAGGPGSGGGPDNGGDSGGGASSAGTAADSGAAAAASASGDSSAAGPAGDSSSGDGGGGGGGGGKIICTAMNQAYGFGAFRQVIWLQYAEKHLTKAHEVGYHTLFLPFVAAGYKHNKWYSSTIRKILEHGTRHRTADLRAEMRGTKRNNLGRFYRTIFEPLCWAVGKLKGH